MARKDCFRFCALSLLFHLSYCFQFTFPVPGKRDYTFATGDIAIVEWTTNESIQLLALNCGPTPDLDNDTPAYAFIDGNITSGVHYQIPETWEDSYHKYCMFCTGTFHKCCSGSKYTSDLNYKSTNADLIRKVFLLEKHAQGNPQVTHESQKSPSPPSTEAPVASSTEGSLEMASSITLGPSSVITSTAQASGPESSGTGESSITQAQTSTDQPITPNPVSSSVVESSVISTPITESLPALITVASTTSLPPITLAKCPASSSVPQISCAVNNATEADPTFNFPLATPPASTTVKSAGFSFGICMVSVVLELCMVALFFILF